MTAGEETFKFIATREGATADILGINVHYHLLVTFIYTIDED
jgi:hypothetical protein